MDNPTVSVIIPTYNAAPLTEAAVGSVLAQTFGDLEVIVVDDASPDGSGARLEGLMALDPRVRVYRQLRNSGPGPARNRALEAAQGRYLAFLDGDDLWEPEKLERQLSFMAQHGAVFSFTGYRVISSEGAELDCIDRIPPRIRYSDLLKNTVIGCSTVVLDRQGVGEVRFPDLRTSQDFALWLGILKVGHVAFGMSDLLTRYRITPRSNTRNKVLAALHVWNVMRHHEGLPLGRALWYFGNYAVRGLVKHLRAR
jgi:teichuronic acid biosynthesis glycosyltransferase TuaG